MTICSHTGVSQPECSCRVCLQSQIERHMPSLLEGAIPGNETPVTVEMPAVARIARRGFRARLRRRRRVA